MRRYALLAQLDRVLDYESRGQGFESLGARQKKTPPDWVVFFYSKRLEHQMNLQVFQSKKFRFDIRKIKLLQRFHGIYLFFFLVPSRKFSLKLKRLTI